MNKRKQERMLEGMYLRANRRWDLCAALALLQALIELRSERQVIIYPTDRA